LLDDATGQRVDIDKKLEVAGSNYGQYMDHYGLNPINDKPLNPQNWTGLKKQTWDDAVKEAHYVSNAPEGTVAHLNEIKKYIGSKYNKAVEQGTNRVEPLRQLKAEVDKMLSANSGVKRLDTDYANAKRLQELYTQGKSARPFTEKPKFKTAEENQAWIKGVQDKLTSDIQTDKNLAKVVRDAENILKKGMDKDKFDNLMKEINIINKEYKKVSGLESKAGRKLDVPVSEDRPYWRELLESVGSSVGGAIDKTTGLVTRKSNINKAMQYLNPDATSITTRGGLAGAGKKSGAYSLRQLINILAEKNDGE